MTAYVPEQSASAETTESNMRQKGLKTDSGQIECVSSALYTRNMLPARVN